MESIQGNIPVALIGAIRSTYREKLYQELDLKYNFIEYNE